MREFGIAAGLGVVEIGAGVGLGYLDRDEPDSFGPLLTPAVVLGIDAMVALFVYYYTSSD